MNFSRIFTAMTIVAAASAAHAQSLYGGGSIGGSDWHGSVDGIDGGSRGVTGKVYGGYSINPNFAIEAGAARLGSMRDANGKVGANSVFVDGVGTLPLADKWSLLGRVGVAQARFSGPTGGDTGTGLKVGTGVQYQLSPTTALRAEYEQYRLNSVFDSHANIGQFTAGVKVNF